MVSVFVKFPIIISVEPSPIVPIVEPSKITSTPPAELVVILAGLKGGKFLVGVI